ncbi:Drug/Metabolite Transporter (DMT) Superfamily [Phytophthora infestans T30-4]|uniref:Drug/Metabolite Transporter (DMT) Superfamily n=1 Tax=Phytophthora infestans (strain T30-4) TaxID=403677 RepID=D0NED2_PHYIT|nr:Drug/Metabolite Transporter (DMT) Superfamily [Phytophthora infestans T30-4]EEY56577.1 Drug/Metabolite Transporter (DMT) Superfamily [Phytophthora infestans T30-4]|eukprot:XP_002902651.1 Drug/Metabolite Transporter (DMT) Superfamily [Phytophthora infestans T30-4]
MSVGENSNEAAPLLPTTSANSTPAKVDGERTPHALLGMTCVALASLCFSFMSTFIKYMTFTFSSMEATFWRSLGVLVLYVEPEFRKILVYRCIAGFACMGVAFYAMSQMVLADASSLVFVSPVLTFFMGALFLNEKIDPISLISAVTAFIGLICVVRPGFLFGYDHPTASTDGSWLKGVNVFVIVHYFALVSVILTMLWLALVQQSFYIPETFLLWRAIIGTGIATFGGQMFLTRGFQLEKAGVAAVMRYLDVVFVFLWDSLILGEHINHWSIVGALVILTCAVIIAVRKIQLTMHE